MNFTNKLRVLFLIIILAGMTATAQTSKPTYKIVGDEIVKVESTKTKAKAEKTKLVHKIKGVSFPVFKSSRGAYFIVRISKKSKKEYKMYLKIK